MRRSFCTCPDSCCYGTVRVDHLLHPNVCVPCSGTDENIAGSFRVSLHRPNVSFIKKQTVVINTAGGGGMRSTVREIKDSTDYWGIARTHILSQKVWDHDWTDLPASFRRSAERKVVRTARNVRRRAEHLTPSFKVRCLFICYQFLHKKQKMSAIDDAYWREKGYVTGKPWK